MANFELDKLVDDVRAANAIEDVVGETHPLRKAGSAWKCETDPSLVVYPRTQTYIQFGRAREGEGLGGDVIRWVMVRDRLLFWDALVLLARRGNVELPSFGEENRAKVLAARLRDDVLASAMEWAQHRLSKSAAAQAYWASRGFDAETVAAARLGYTGDSWEERNSLRDWLQAREMPADHPVAVAFVGYKGNLAAWWDKWREQLYVSELPKAWAEKGQISGLPFGYVVYPYFERGRCVQAKARAIDPQVDKADRMRNLRVELVGPKRPFFNFQFNPNGEHVIYVEGEGDATALGVMEHPSVAIGSRDEPEGTVEAARKIRTRYIGFSTDAWGLSDLPEAERAEQAELAAETWEKALRLAERLGPRTRLITWPAHDANDWLKALQAEGRTLAQMQDEMRKVLRTAPTLVEALANQAGQAEGDERDAALRRAFAQVIQLEAADLEVKRDELAQLMNLRTRQFNGLLKAAREAAEDAEAEAEERAKETDYFDVGVSNPIYVDGHFMDVVYHAKRDRQMLGVRYPDGRIDQRESVEIGANRYFADLNPVVLANARQPINPNSAPAILFPADVGDKDLTVGALMDRVWAFTYKYVDIPDEKRRIFCGYVLLTWLHDCFNDVGYIRALGPWGKGKSRFVLAFGALCYRALRAAGLSTLSPLFRIKSYTPATFVFDEINNGNLPLAPDVEVFFNLTNSVHSPPIWRSEGKDAVPTSFGDGYSPKVFGAIRDFSDPATSSRCLDVKMTAETTRTDIEQISVHFWEEAEALRADLMRFRLRHWQPELRLKSELIPATITGRVRQIAVALISLIDDEKTRANIITALQERTEEIVNLQAGDIKAKIVRALCWIMKRPAKQGRQGKPYRDLRMQRVYDMVKEWIFDEEDAAPALKPNGEKDPDSARNNPKHWLNRYYSPRRIGEAVRVDLGIRTERVTWNANKPLGAVLADSDWPRLRALMAQYGVTEADIALTKAEVQAMTPEERATVPPEELAAAMAEDVAGDPPTPQAEPAPAAFDEMDAYLQGLDDL